jgi:hypothetical protein
MFSAEDEYALSLCIIAFVLHGAAHAFGESVILGFFKFFPSQAVEVFSSGTGFSELFTLSGILLFNNLGIFFGKVIIVHLLK